MVTILEQKIREDLPQLKDVNVGCVIKKFDGEVMRIISVVHSNDGKRYWCLNLKDSDIESVLEEAIYDKEYFEIIGQDITLNIVLKWIKIYNQSVVTEVVDLGGGVKVLSFIHKDKLYYWDLKYNILEKQSKDFIGFLNSLKDA